MNLLPIAFLLLFGACSTLAPYTPPDVVDGAEVNPETLDTDDGRYVDAAALPEGHVDSPDPLAQLITQNLERSAAGATASLPSDDSGGDFGASSGDDAGDDAAGGSSVNGGASPSESTKTVPVAALPAFGYTAQTLWKMRDEQCMALLKEHDIAVKKPDFSVNFVKTPLLLEGPINGVRVAPKWNKKTISRVMDCRLIAALIPMTALAAREGFTSIGFYSTLRPIIKPDQDCDSKKCRQRQKTYERGLKGKFNSQHNRGLAIDIRWFTRADGTEVDVLADYPKESSAPPCETVTGDGDKAQFLQRFACTLHARKVFNVILTPNANQAHENHFHMDITPGAGWYIVR